MPITRSFDKPFELTDYTEALLLIPNTWGLINQLGIFDEEGITQHNITIEKSEKTLSILPDQFRGARHVVNQDDTRQLLSFPIPHYNQQDSISPSDVQGKRAYFDPNAADTETRVMAEKLKRIRMNHAATLERARAFAITSGAVYAPNGTVVADYYTSFGVTRKVVDFDMTATTDVDIIAKVEEVIAHIQDNILSGEMITGYTALCSPEFFSALIAYPTIREAYLYYSRTQDPLASRLGGMTRDRTFNFGGINFIEYRGSYNDNTTGTTVRLIPAGDAYVVPMGTSDSFKTYFSPANRFGLVNTVGESVYMFSHRSPMDDEIVLLSESNHLNLLRRPQSVVRCTVT